MNDSLFSFTWHIVTTEKLVDFGSVDYINLCVIPKQENTNLFKYKIVRWTLVFVVAIAFVSLAACLLCWFKDVVMWWSSCCSFLVPIAFIITFLVFIFYCWKFFIIWIFIDSGVGFQNLCFACVCFCYGKVPLICQTNREKYS